MYKLVSIAAVLLVLTGCVTPDSLEQQAPSLSYEKTGKVLISVVDERKRVKEGKPNDYIGRVHSSFGIPFDWHVKQVISTEDGDKERNLSDWLEYRIVHGLNNGGWETESVNLDSGESDSDVQQILLEKGAVSLIKLTLREWYFSINLNWVSAFNFDTDAIVSVYDIKDGVILNKVFKERDVIEESSTESPQNNVLRAYRDQLQQILGDDRVENALLGDVSQSALK